MKARSVFRPLAAALAILLSPGALGPWLQMVHACPVATGSMAGHARHHQHGDHGPHGRPVCQCVGSCHSAALPVPPVAALQAAVTALPAQPRRPRPTTAVLTRAPYLLPFAQAPPVLL